MTRNNKLRSILTLCVAAILVAGCRKDDEAKRPSSVVASSPTPTSAPSPTAAPTPEPGPTTAPSAVVDPSPQPQSGEQEEGELSDALGTSGVKDAEDDNTTSAATPEAQEKDVFKIQITLVRDGVTEYDEPTYFVGDQAIELTWSDNGKLLASYDLADMSWWEASNGILFTLDDCKEWAQLSLETTHESIDEAPDSLMKRFVLAMMEPDLEVTDGDKSLTVSNEFYTFTYHTDGPIKPERLKRFFAYDRLKNYRKSRLFGDNPPFMRLEIDDLLEERALFPHRTELKVKLPGADSGSTITMTIGSVTEEEMNTLSSYIE